MKSFNYMVTVEIPFKLGVDYRVYSHIVQAIMTLEQTGIYELSHEYFVAKYGKKRAFRMRAKGLIPYPINVLRFFKYLKWLKYIEYTLMYHHYKVHGDSSLKPLVEKGAKGLSIEAVNSAQRGYWQR